MLSVFLGMGSVIPAAPMRQALKLGDPVDKRQLHRAGRAVTLLADDDFGHTRFLAGFLGVEIGRAHV